MYEKAQTIGLAVLALLLMTALIATIVIASDVYLLIFLSVLCSVLFSRLANLVGRWTNLPYSANLGGVVAGLVLLSVSMGVFFGLRIEHQIQRTSEQLDDSHEKVMKWLEQHGTVKNAIRRLPLVEDLLTDHPKPKQPDDSGNPSNDSKKQSNDGDDIQNSASAGWTNIGTMNSVSGRVFGVLGKAFSTSFGFTMNVAFIFFVGVFLAIKPHYYRDNLARLFPISNRSRVVEILDRVGETLWKWLIGRAATMLITGAGTGLMLWWLGVPLALTLGVITGILTFIPNIGSVLALLLSMLVALSQGPSTVWWVVVIYAALQFAESNIITPIIQQRQTEVPPPLLLSSQLMLGVLTGFLGVIVATPLLASAIVIVKEAYLIDVLGEDANS